MECEIDKESNLKLVYVFLLYSVHVLGLNSFFIICDLRVAVFNQPFVHVKDMGGIVVYEHYAYQSVVSSIIEGVPNIGQLG